MREDLFFIVLHGTWGLSIKISTLHCFQHSRCIVWQHRDANFLITNRHKPAHRRAVALIIRLKPRLQCSSPLIELSQPESPCVCKWSKTFSGNIG